MEYLLRQDAQIRLSVANGIVVVERILEVVGALGLWRSTGSLSSVLLWCLLSACSVPMHSVRAAASYVLRYLFESYTVLCFQRLFV